VTGFGLLGHLLEIAKGSKVAAGVEWAAIPLLEGALEFAREGIVTGASGAIGRATATAFSLASTLGESHKAVLTDPQTSGGLWSPCAPESCDEVLAIFRNEGFPRAAVIGEIAAGEPRVEIL
jgi:selenide,water dikinase